MSRCLCVVLLSALSVSFVGCQTLGGQKSAEKAALEAPERTLSYPDETVAVVRVQPEQAALLIDRVTRNFDDAEEGPADEISKMAAEFDGFGQQFVLAQLDPEDGFRIDTSEEQPELEGFDAERAIVVAYTTQGNDAYIEHFVYASPQLDFSQMPAHGTRLFIPAGEPSALRDSLSKECEAESDCEELRRLDVVDEWVVADLSARDIDGLEPSPDGEASAFFERQTTAANAFLAGGGAFATYLKFDEVTDFLHMQEAFTVAGGIPTASPRHRWTMLLRSIGRSMAGPLLDPAAREKEDIAAVLRTREDATALVDVYGSYTEKGARIAAQARNEARLPTTEVEAPTVEFEYALDTGAALEEATAPSWMVEEETDDRRERDVDDVLRESHILLTTMVASTFGTLRGFGESPRAPAEANEFLDYFDGLLAARGSIRADDPKAAPSGAVAILVESESPADGRIASAIEVLEARAERLGEVDLTSTVDERDEEDRRLHRVALGVDESAFGKETPAKEAVSVQADAAMLAEIASGVSWAYASMQRRLFDALLASFSRLELSHASGEKGLAMRLAIDSEEDRPVELPDSSAELRQPDGPDECARKVREKAVTVYRGERDSSFSTDDLERLDSGLAALKDECEASADAIERARGNWQLLAAYMAADKYDFGLAGDFSERACDFGRSQGCEVREHFASLADWVTLPSTSPTVGLESIPDRMAFVSARGLTRIQVFDLVEREIDVEPVSESVDGWTKEVLDQPLTVATSRGADDGEIGAYVGIAPVVQARHVEAFMAAVDEKSDDTSKDSAGGQTARRARQRSSHTFAAFAVGLGDELTANRRPAVAFRLEEPSGDDDDSVEIAVEANGIAASVDGEVLNVDEDCDGQVTVCAEDADQTSELLEEADPEAFEAASDDAVDAFTEQYDFERLRNALADSDAADADASYEIVVDEATPFGLVAATAGTVAEATDADITSGGVLDLYLRTR